MLTKLQRYYYSVIPVLFLVIYFQVFFADYAYLDEINQLWNNRDNSNFLLFHTQGRWLTGLLFQKLFSSLTHISQLKWLRVFSFTGWIFTALLWAHLSRKWITALQLDLWLWVLGVLYFVAGLPVVVYIGWASCMEVFIGIAAALLSGHFLFTKFCAQTNEIQISNKTLILTLFFGVVSLFTYQTTFGAFLLPFFFLALNKEMPFRTKKLMIGIVIYLLTYAIYYFLFKYSLKAYGVTASTRTEIQLQFLSKLSFFFSGPIPEGFSLNFIYTSRSLFSQILYIVVIIGWLTCVFGNKKGGTPATKAALIATLFGLLALIYIPLLIAVENFASSRTLFAFNLAVLLMVAHSFLAYFDSEKSKKIMTLVLATMIVGSGYFAYNIQFVNPLVKEYSVIKNHMQASYSPRVNTVQFIRADRNLFKDQFGCIVAKDEFGSPSTYKDWVPEHLTRQLIFEQTKNRAEAEKIGVIQYEERSLLDAAGGVADSSLIVNVNALLGGK